MLKDKLSILWSCFLDPFSPNSISQTWGRMNNFARVFCFIIIPVYHITGTVVFFIENILLTRDS